MLAASWLNNTLEFVQRMIVTRNLTFMLVVGLILLSVALFILTRTRWGQAKPVSKCIALSILAHVLLGGYAWSTKLMFSVPAIDNSHPTKVTLVNAEPAEPESPTTETQADLKPWQKFDQSADPVKTTEHVGPENVTQDIKIQKTAAPEPQLQVVQPKTEHAPAPIQQTNSVPAQTASFRISAAPTDAETIEIKRRRVENQKPLLQPNTQQPQRLQAINNTIQAERENTRPNGPLIDIQKRIESITKNATQIAAATNSNQFNQFETVNRRIDQSKTDDGELMKVDLVTGKTPKRLDGTVMPEVYRLRSDENRLSAAKKLGGSEQTEKAVKAALKWLADNQQQDGRWNPRHTGAGQDRNVFGHNRQGAGSNADTGISALAILAFLGAGHTQNDGPYQDNVLRGLQFLMNKQKQNGSLAGDARLYAQMYCHSMALFALSEAYALTRDARLKAAVEKGVNYSFRAQNSTDGGWRYQPGDPGDMSQFGWQVMALKAAKLGGVNIPDKTTARMKSFLQSCSKGKSGGLAAYRPVERASTSMTAEALVCRYFLLGQIDKATADEATKLIEQTLPNKQNINYYYWYYGTLAMFHTGGPRWEKWNRELTTVLVKTQNTTGTASGSWDPNGLWSGYGGRVYSTAMSTLCLEVYYRYLSSLK